MLGIHVGTVDFKLFVSISFALGSQHRRSFWWNMDGYPYTNVLMYMFDYNREYDKFRPR